MPILRFLIPGLFGLLLSACATPPEPVNEQSRQDWDKRLQQLTPIQDWQMRGRVAVFVNDEVHHVGLHWLRSGSSSSLSLEASLGQGLIKLEKKPDGVELTTSEGQQYSGDNAQSVIYQATGLTIPFEGLQSWIKGIPHGNSKYTHEIDAGGRASRITQDNWFINFLEYESVDLPEHGTPELPRKLYMKHQRLALKIVLDQWRSPQTSAPDPGLFPDFPR